jgi:hypothetical protein
MQQMGDWPLSAREMNEKKDVLNRNKNRIN